MADRNKISNGPNDRPVDESIAQTGGGLPDDSSSLPPEDEAGKRGGAGGDRKPEAPPHRLQPSPAEGSREAVEEELRRKSDKEQGG